MLDLHETLVPVLYRMLHSAPDKKGKNMPQNKTEKSNFGKRKESIHCFTSLSDQEKSNINIVMPKKLTPIENSHLFLSTTSRQPGQNKKK